jgi:hypothetical protein
MIMKMRMSMVQTLPKVLTLVAFLLLRRYLTAVTVNIVRLVCAIFKIGNLLRQGNPFKSTKRRLAGFIVNIIQFTYLSYQIIRCKD